MNAPDNLVLASRVEQAGGLPTWRELAARRFGRDHDKPCQNPNVLSCSFWQCQKANECQGRWDYSALASTEDRTP